MLNVAFKVFSICERIVIFVVTPIFKAFAFAWFVLGIILAVNFSTVQAETINLPSHIEAAPTPPRNVGAKILNSGLQCREMRTEKGINVLRSRGDIGIDGTKLGQNSSTESGARSCTTPTVSGTGAKPCYKASEQNSTENGIGIGQEGVDHLWWFIWIAIALSPLFMATTQTGEMKHNEAVEKPQPTRNKAPHQASNA